MFAINAFLLVLTIIFSAVWLACYLNISYIRKTVRSLKVKLKFDNQLSEPMKVVYFCSHHQLQLMDFIITELFNYSVLIALIAALTEGFIQVKGHSKIIAYINDVLNSPTPLFYLPLTFLFIAFIGRLYVDRAIEHYNNLISESAQSASADC